MGNLCRPIESDLKNHTNCHGNCYRLAPPMSHSKLPDLSLQGKPEAILRHCVYMIATGQWSAGERLPSIRQCEQEWGVHRLTVHKAYKRLAEMGLAESRPRSGYYVAGGGTVQRASEHRHELERLHERVARMVRGTTGLSVLGVLRYLTEVEEIRRREDPECAFVECTATQAEGHAAEIAGRLRLPVAALTTAQVAGRRTRVPRRIRTLLTSPFHLEELRPLASPPELTVTAVPIEVSPEISRQLPAGTKELVLMESEENMAEHIAEDLKRLLGGAGIRVVLVAGTGRDLDRRLSDKPDDEAPVTLLSPRLWGSLDPEHRSDPRIHQVTFRVRDEAWPRVAEAIGLPLGMAP